MISRLAKLRAIAAVVSATIGLIPSPGNGARPVIATAERVNATVVRQIGSDRPEKKKPSSQEIDRLRSVAATVRRGVVFLLATDGPSVASHGSIRATGFVVSRKHRLIATAAHFADRFASGARELAIVDGTTQWYAVKRVWYHPGLLRVLDDGLYAVSYEPRDGEIAYGAADVAVLQLSDEGPELSAELRLASDEELKDLEGQIVGFLGYPAQVGDSLAERSQPDAATFFTCAIELMNDVTYNDRELVPMERRQYLWYDCELGPGGSGSPIFLANGHVVGLATDGIESEPTDAILPDRGLRVDCVRELLAYHKLGDTNPNVARVATPRAAGAWTRGSRNIAGRSDSYGTPKSCDGPGNMARPNSGVSKPLL